jgi:CspA family cold shock protein
MEETNFNKPAEEAAVSTSAVMLEGTVKSYDLARRYGFIAHAGSTKTVFVHQEAILGEGDRTLQTGDRVSFELTEGPRGPRAASVRKL